MHESSAYEMFLDDGKIAQLHKTLKRLGQRRFGGITSEFESIIDAIDDIDRLDRMTDAIFEAKNWTELLETP